MKSNLLLTQVYSTWLFLGVQHMQHFCRAVVPAVACTLVEKVESRHILNAYSRQTCAKIYPESSSDLIETRLLVRLVLVFTQSFWDLWAQLLLLWVWFWRQRSQNCPGIVEHFPICNSIACSCFFSKVYLCCVHCTVCFLRFGWNFKSDPVEVGCFEFH